MCTDSISARKEQSHQASTIIACAAMPSSLCHGGEVRLHRGDHPRADQDESAPESRVTGQRSALMISGK